MDEFKVLRSVYLGNLYIALGVVTTSKGRPEPSPGIWVIFVSCPHPAVFPSFSVSLPYFILAVTVRKC